VPQAITFEAVHRRCPFSAGSGLVRRIRRPRFGHLGHEHFFVRRHVGDEMPPHNCARLLPGVVWSSAVDPSFPRKISVPSKSAFALRPSNVLRPPIAGSVLLSIGHIQIEFFIRRPRLPACSFPELAAAISLPRPRDCVLPRLKIIACFIVRACGYLCVMCASARYR
jgi:hypothetical protein